MRCHVLVALALVSFAPASTVAKPDGGWDFSFPGNVAFRVAIDATPRAPVELTVSFGTVGVEEDGAYLIAQSFAGVQVFKRVIYHNGAAVKASMENGVAGERVESLGLPGEFGWTTTWGYNPGNLTLVFDWTGGVTSSRFSLRVQDPNATAKWSFARDIRLLTLEDFRESGSHLSARGVGVGANVADGAAASVTVHRGLTGFSYWGGGLHVGQRQFDVHGPEGSRNAEDLFFIDDAPGTYTFSVSQRSAGLFPAQPYVLVADFPH
jgi:hypothetical protein